MFTGAYRKNIPLQKVCKLIIYTLDKENTLIIKQIYCNSQILELTINTFEKMGF